jgi:hypothetical protein
MSIKPLNGMHASFTDQKSILTYQHMEELLTELGSRNLPADFCQFVNERVDSINTSSLNGSALRKFIIQQRMQILKRAEKELKLVPQNHYRSQWTLLGISAFGLPIGTAIGMGMGNIGLLGVGLPFGMAIGFTVGARLDKKALRQGRQLNIQNQVIL